MSCPIPVPSLLAAIAAGAVELVTPDGSVVRRPRYLPRPAHFVAVGETVHESVHPAPVVDIATRRAS